MQDTFLMGNEAIALGAIASGVNVVAGYPGTPSTEVLETVAKHNDGSIYVEWSTNEKAAMELAAGAAYADARTLVTMKQVGLNVASDPLMSLAYIGVKGGMVVMVADDPGPISSQTEQDTRTFAAFSKLPCFDPSSVQEAYEMIQDAFEFSEKHHTPVIFRPTTRVCHAYASVTIREKSECRVHKPAGFVKDSKKWVIFPKLSFNAHREIELRNRGIADEFSAYARNSVAAARGAGARKGVASHGANWAYVMDALKGFDDAPAVLKVATPFPFPEKLALEFLKDKDEVLCVEELDPVIERALVFVCGKYGLNVRIRGKLTDDIALSGENTCDSVAADLRRFLCDGADGAAPSQFPCASAEEGGRTSVSAVCAGCGADGASSAEAVEPPPALPVRPPVLCAGCPHRASFYAVKEAMKGRKALFCGDIGCYTLGNAAPLDMVDTCLCMGAGVNIAQGIGRVEPDTACFAFVGDSTFFASAITGAVNAVYNKADMTLVVLDNSTTAMTGHQPHPGTGVRMMEFANGGKPADAASRLSIENILKGIGLAAVEVVDPLDLKAAVDCVKRVSAIRGVKAIIFRSPCIAVAKSARRMEVDAAKCIGCKKCIRALGCPAVVTREGRVVIDPAQCTGCGLCAQVCPVGAIGEAERKA